MSRRRFLCQLAATTIAARWAWAVAKPKRRPNIFLIVADDLGYGELSVQGSRDIPTRTLIRSRKMASDSRTVT